MHRSLDRAVALFRREHAAMLPSAEVVEAFLSVRRYVGHSGAHDDVCDAVDVLSEYSDLREELAGAQDKIAHAERVRRWAETQRADRERTLRIAAEQDAGRCDVCARECVTIAVCGQCELPEATR